MSLLYRSIWEDSREDLRSVARHAMRRWLDEQKHLDVGELTDGEVGFETATGPTRLSTTSGKASGRAAVRTRLIEIRPASGERWITTLTAITADESEDGGTLWVDLERVSEDPFARVPLRVPNLVRSLIHDAIDTGGMPRVGHVPLLRRPEAIDASGLAGLVRNQERRISLAVFSHDPVGGIQVTLDRARVAYDRLLGVAQVYLLAPDQIDEFNERIGEDLAVWGGAARLYLPNRGAGGLVPERHRYVPAFRTAKSVSAAAGEFSTQLSSMVTASLPPDGYDELRPALVGGDRTSDEFLGIALEENALLTSEVEGLRANVADQDEEVFELQAQIDNLETEVNRRAAEIASLWATFGKKELAGDHSLPTEVDTIAEVLELSANLHHVVVAVEAPVDIDKLDSSVQSRSWAMSIWRALRALDGYAANVEDISGGFWEWCQQTHTAWKWPASTKKLAMTESESVLNSDRLRRARQLPIATAVSIDGLIEMLSHIKIAQGGGPLAPRIYFYDDTSGSTGKVHVGFIGPHEHMPNKGTN
jgi:hypothetical protein